MAFTSEWALPRNRMTEIYRRYLDCLNERRWDDLGEFVSDDATHNGRPLGPRGYREMLEADIAAVPDLAYATEAAIAAQPQA